MNVLFIGGTGIISSACSPLAIERGIDLTLFNRGTSPREIPAGAKVIHGDIRDLNAARSLLGNQTFDAVVDWVAYTPEQVQADLDLLRGRVGQYVFISSASAYQKPLSLLPVTESTPLANPFWQYSRNKIACEELLMRAYRSENFPVTIIRPAHTYDRRSLPFRGRWTVVDRMRRGKPVVVHGDGSSLWTLTHHEDFARAFVPLLGNNHAIGETFHITSDESLDWNAIFRLVGQAAGAEPKLVHVPSEVINRYDEDWGASLLGDKMQSMVFDNSKIKRAVPGWSATIPFAEGARQIIAWYDADPRRKEIDVHYETMLNDMIAKMEAVRP